MHAASVVVHDACLAAGEHAEQDGDAAQQVVRFEAHDAPGNAVVAREEFVGRTADDGRDVSWQYEGVDGDLGIVDERFKRMRYGLVRGKDAEVLDAGHFGALDGGGDERRRGLEANTHEDDLAVGIFLCAAQPVEGGVDDADVASGGFLLVE